MNDNTASQSNLGNDYKSNSTLKCWNFNYNEANKCNGKGLSVITVGAGQAAGDQSTISGTEFIPPRQQFSPGLRSVSQAKRIGTNQTVRTPTLAQNGATRSTALFSNPRPSTVGGGVGSKVARRM